MTTMSTVRKFLEKCNIDAETRFDEPLAPHTSFKIGGPADAFVLPRSEEALATLLKAASQEGIAAQVIGGGANLLIADGGVRGIVLCTALMQDLREESAFGAAAALDAESSAREGSGLYAAAGVSVTRLVGFARDRSLAGLEFAAGLPGSVGGAVYMNARCYEREFADLLVAVRYLDTTYDAATVGIDRQAWAYKQTPFMPGASLAGSIVLGASFALSPGNREALSARMRQLEEDRRQKGHFDYPSAGSLFKNNRAFGRPSGKILDELGFKGRRVGDAMVSPKHANIFVNAGRASARDMMTLIQEAQEAVRKAYGFELEPEVVTLGEF
ncbi:MAG TPA: UDP-N-acetylenolpyruvoylglucosamine reductase [Spirochaetaceae bacterium]|nr:UDP-N-acetylenolpyruvoylglucosamine reductase [Spirochaetaceae bacterium]